MNSQKKIKEKSIKLLKFVFGDKARNLWFMASYLLALDDSRRAKKQEDQ